MKNEETPDEIECTVCKTIFYTEEEITKHCIEEHNHRKDRYEQ